MKPKSILEGSSPELFISDCIPKCYSPKFKHTHQKLSNQKNKPKIALFSQ